jgi:outer membrane lipoprotein-sorting protein
MIGTFFTYYLAFVLQSGSLPAAAPAAPAKAAKAAPAKPAAGLVIAAEDRDRAPTAAPSQHLGSGIIVSTAGGAKVATAPTADEVVEKVQAFYKDIQQVTASFRQKVTNATFGRSTTTDGQVWIKKPGKMRWDYKGKKTKGKKKAPVTKSFISNGDYLYVVDRQNKQVIEKNLEKNMLPVAVTFLYGKGDLKADFTAKLDTSKKYAGKDDIALELTPKVASTQYKTLYLVVDKSNFRVKQSVIIDSAGNVNHFYFYTPDFEKAVKDSWFLFDKKSVPDYRIVTDDDDEAADDTKTK